MTGGLEDRDYGRTTHPRYHYWICHGSFVKYNNLTLFLNDEVLKLWEKNKFGPTGRESKILLNLNKFLEFDVFNPIDRWPIAKFPLLGNDDNRLYFQPPIDFTYEDMDDFIVNY